MFNVCIVSFILIRTFDLNTSHVNVQRRKEEEKWLFIKNLNTSHVNVQPHEQVNNIQCDKNLNTSHVNVQL
ncbi:hypothetical protein ACXAT2_003801 [Clostridium sporogenes]